MKESVDIIKLIADFVVKWVTALPPSIYSFPLRSALILGAVFLACAWSFDAGSRWPSLQISIACLVTFSVMLLVPVERFSEWLRHSHGNLCTFVFGVALGLTGLLPALVPRFLVPQHSIQVRLVKSLYGALAGLLFLDLLVTAVR